MNARSAAVSAAVLAIALVAALPSYAQVEPSATQLPASAIAWDQVPSAAQLAAIYSARKNAPQAPGRSQIRCALQPDGALKDCAVMAEGPSAASFGWSAIAAAKLYKAHLTEQLQSAIANGGVSIVLTFDWAPPPSSASPRFASAQDVSPDDAPTAPTVPATSQVAANPMPARRSELEKAASEGDFATIRAILDAAKTGDEVNRNMDWEELQVVQGGSVFYSFRYLDDLWAVGSRFPDPATAAKIQRFAGVIGLYTLEQIEIDAPRCADPSAPGHRVDQLTQGRAALWKSVMGLPEVTRRDLAVEALKLEGRTARLRRDDPVLCSGGAQDMARALSGDTAELAPNSGGRREVQMTPHPSYVEPAASAPKQAQVRASMPMLLARALKLPEAQPK